MLPALLTDASSDGSDEMVDRSSEDSFSSHSDLSDVLGAGQRRRALRGQGASPQGASSSSYENWRPQGASSRSYENWRYRIDP